jgi:hypothetical protein
LRKEREEKKAERERQRRRAEAQVVNCDIGMLKKHVRRIVIDAYLI